MKQLYKVKAIVGETSRWYKIEWEGTDPATSKSWKPTWEKKANANSAAVRDWQLRKYKHDAESKSFKSVTAPEYRQGNFPMIPAKHLAKRGPGGKHGPSKVLWLPDLIRQMKLVMVEGYEMQPFFTWNNSYRVYEFVVDKQKSTLPWWTKWTIIPAMVIAIAKDREQHPMHTRFFTELSKWMSNQLIARPPIDLAFEYFFLAEDLQSRALTVMALLMLPQANLRPISTSFSRALKHYVEHAKPIIYSPHSTDSIHGTNNRRRIDEWITSYISKSATLQTFKRNPRFRDLVIATGLFPNLELHRIAEEIFGDHQ